MISHAGSYPEQPGHVILVHGLGGWPSLMQPLARRLQHRGFETRCWGYASTRSGINHSAGLLRDYLLEHYSDCPGKVHLVTHSMGGILARIAITGSPVNGRLLMLAPPNHGSPVARWLSVCLGRICQPLRELSDDKSSFVNRLPALPADIESGVIAAASDRVLPPGSTQIANANHHITVDAGHTSMLFQPGVAAHCARFLEHGAFYQSHC